MEEPAGRSASPGALGLADDSEQSLELPADLQEEAQQQQQEQDGGGAAAWEQPDEESQPEWQQQPAPLPFVKDCWEESFDMNSQRTYFFNRATGVSCWDPPGPDWVAAAATAGAAGGGPAAAVGESGAAQPQQQQQQQQQQPQQQQEEEGAPSYEPGFYYRDASAQLQGPFSLEHLQAWRGSLPMDLAILELVQEAGPGEQQQEKQQQDAPDSNGGNQAGAATSRWVHRELAVLLGDEQLLERWRMDNPEQAAGTAPHAAAYEAEAQQGSGTQWLADAVLSGLPADDDAVAMARMAAAAGKSIQEVAEWSRRHTDYSATAYRVAARGRIQTGGGQESLYAEAASWTNPAQLEQQLAKAAAQRKRQLSGEELRQIRERKKELKKQKQTGWLYT